VRESSITRSYSLEQFINIRMILKLYKVGQLENMSPVSNLISKSKKLATQKKKMDFLKGGRDFETGVELLKRGSFLKGTLNIIKSICISRFYILKVNDHFMFKLKNMLKKID
jgi:hypothetical protein